MEFVSVSNDDLRLNDADQILKIMNIKNQMIVSDGVGEVGTIQTAQIITPPLPCFNS